MKIRSLGEAVELIKAAFKDWQEDRAERLAAALAYYTMFSIAPLLLIIIAIVGLVYGQDAARGQIVGQIGGLVGQENAQVVEGAIQKAYNPGANILSTVLGIGLLLLGATGLFGSLKDSLNAIWEVKPKPGQGVMAILRDRFLSFTMVLGIGFLLLTSLVLSAGLAALGNMLSNLLPGSELLWEAVNFVVSFGVVSVLFAMIYKILPDVKIAWRDVWFGAVVTALLFTIGKFLLGLYIGYTSVGSAFGAAGSLAVILVWVYYSAQILFFGAEMTQVYANRYGSRLQPEASAVRITTEDRAQQGMPRQAAVEAAARRAEGGEVAAGEAEGGAATRRAAGESVAPAARSAGRRAEPAAATGSSGGGFSPWRTAVLAISGLLAAKRMRSDDQEGNGQPPPSTNGRDDSPR